MIKMDTLLIVAIVYIIVLVFLLAVTYLKIKRKEKYTFWLWVLLCYAVIIPILYLCFIASFSASPIEAIETLNMITPNIK